MLSVRNVGRSDLTDILDANPALQVELSLVNGPDRFVLSGLPRDLRRFIALAQERAGDEEQAIASKLRGGVPFAPVFDFITVSTPFHSHLLDAAYTQVLEWAQAANLPNGLAESLGAAVLTDHVDWTAQLDGLRQLGARWILDLGPGNTLATGSSSSVSRPPPRRTGPSTPPDC